MAEPWEEPDPQEKVADAIKQQSQTLREMMFGRQPTAEEMKKAEAKRDTAIALGEQRWGSLPRFRYWIRPCPSCGTWRPATAHFHPANELEWPRAACASTPSCLEHAALHPHFLRVCRRCTHYWWERPRG